LTLTSAENGGVSGTIYKSYEDAEAGTNGEYFNLTNYDYTSYETLDHYVYTTSLTVDGNAAVYYIEFTNSYATNLIITASGSSVLTTNETTSALNRVTSDENGAVRVFDLSGRQVNAETYRSQAGTYIVRAHGQVRKVVIR
jgi:hypothetical protein